MDATPPPELADHEKRIAKLENAVTNLSCELQSLRSHLDVRFEQVAGHFKHLENSLDNLRIELRAEFEAKLYEAMEKLNARMDSQNHLIVGLLIAIFLALVALVAKM
ncbi:hypothetical protein [Pseudoduganella violaceinigra]|uniref:hypothetical protein n=1 Tax=Pseudoduganella violaceinigra TaxID=246602 RepID=UPI000485F425|nr:hypothetical protein [Pseudoduganella violaceinigra]